MAVFSYVGVDRNSTIVKGTVAADTPRQAREELRDRGVRVRKLAECATKTPRRWAAAFSLASRQTQWATAVHELAMLLHAGIPLLDAIDTLVQQHSGSFRAAILGVRDRVAAGSSLAEALRAAPRAV